MRLMKNIFIVGLRRSGTTILWRLLRQLPAYTCYDEPYHPRLWEGQNENLKGTWDEMERFKSSHPEFFKGASLGITCDQEPESSVKECHVLYLQKLMDDGPVVIDSVRVWNKLSRLLRDDGNTVVVHVARSPLSWVTAHMLPETGNGLKSEVASLLREVTFFRRKTWFDNWQYESLIQSALENTNLFERVINNQQHLKNKPAYAKLLGFWLAGNTAIDEQLEKFTNNPTIRVSLEGLVANPAFTLGRIGEAAGFRGDQISTQLVKPIRRPFREKSDHWDRALDFLGLPKRIKDPDEAFEWFAADCGGGQW